MDTSDPGRPMTGIADPVPPGQPEPAAPAPALPVPPEPLAAPAPIVAPATSGRTTVAPASGRRVARQRRPLRRAATWIFRTHGADVGLLLLAAVTGVLAYLALTS